MAVDAQSNIEAEIEGMPQIVKDTFAYALDEAQKEAEADLYLTPFTTLVVGEDAFIEKYPDVPADQWSSSAQHTVEGAQGARAYAFCYNGDVRTSEGQKDAIIVEGGVPGDPQGYAACLIYELTPERKLKFAPDMYYISRTRNFMAKHGIAQAAATPAEGADQPPNAAAQAQKVQGQQAQGIAGPGMQSQQANGQYQTMQPGASGAWPAQQPSGQYPPVGSMQNGYAQANAVQGNPQYHQQSQPMTQQQQEAMQNLYKQQQQQFGEAQTIQEGAGQMSDEKKNLGPTEEPITIKDGEKEEYEYAKEIGEPIKEDKE